MRKKKIIDSLKVEVDRCKLLGLLNDDAKEKVRRLDSCVEELMGTLIKLEDLGVIVRDLEYGLIDFPADRYGEKVYLCWKYDEPEVLYWHREDEGFARRKPIRTQLVLP